MKELLTHVNCELDENEVSNELVYEFFQEDSIIERTSNCVNYFKTMNIAVNEIRNEKFEEEFPLGFSIAVHHQIGILEAFLSELHCILGPTLN